MPYALKYQTQFDSDPDTNNPSVRYTLQFLFKDYAGAAISITGGSTTVLQKCTIDDPLAAIKGQSLEILLINEGNLPITNFYADNDNDIQVKLLDANNNPLFIGFLVQDDCHEVMVDYAHEIQLSANDNLGLLKNIPLNQAPASYELSYISTETVSTTAPHILQTGLGFGSTVIIGDRIRIIGTAQAGDYTVVSFVIVGSNYQFTVLESIGTMAPTVTDLGLLHSNLIGNVTLLSLIKRCLSATNVSVLTNIFCNIKEQRQLDTRSHFEQTLINPDTFISGEDYEDCYNVLTKILETFDCQLSQTNGQWNIIHWFEIRLYANNAIPGYIYDEDMLFIGTTMLNDTIFVGPDPQLTVPIYPLYQDVVRGFKFVRRQFNYVTSKYLLYNFDLKILGPLIRTYINGSDTISEYIPVGFYNGDLPPHGELFIRVIKNTVSGIESLRYLHVAPPQGNFPRAAVGAPDIIIHKGDTASFSASWRTNVTSTNPFNVLMSFKITSGATSYFLYNNINTGRNEWHPSFGYTVTVPANTPATEWNQLELVDPFTDSMPPFPFDGTLNIHYALASVNVTGTFWKDMRFEYTTRINESTKIIGHVHTQTRTNDIKNNSDTEIFLDDSPRNPINGALLLNTLTNGIPDLTASWQYNVISGIYYKRGQLFTKEDIIYRDKMRSKFEGGFIGLKQNGLVSILSVAITDFYPTKNYIFGLLTIDYKRNQFNGTLWEIWDTVEPDVMSDYSFNYIYDTK